jgi:Flp pilus assembly protein TadD
MAAVLSIQPDHPAGNRRLAVLLGQLGDTMGSIRCWRQVVAMAGPDDVEAATFLGMALSTEGHHDEAIQILTGVTARHRRKGSAHADLGMALLSARRFEEALSAFTRARDLDPASAQAQCGLGLVYQELGRWWEAAEALRRAEQLAPDNPVAPMNLGAVLHRLGEHVEARRALERAAALAPDDAEIRQALEQQHAVPEVVPDAVTRPAMLAPHLDPSITGDVKTFKLVDVLEFLRLQKKSGSLTVSSPRGEATVSLARGMVVCAAAPGIRRLGHALVEQKLISPDDLRAAASAVLDDQDDSLGTVLLKMGRIDKATLGTAVSRQIMKSLDEMLSWSEGAFFFHEIENDVPPTIAFDLQKIMLTLVNRSDERARAQLSQPRK